MKKILLTLAALTTVGVSSTALADSAGVRVGVTKAFVDNYSSDSSFSIGGQYTHSLDALSSLRGSIDLYPNMYGSSDLGFGGEVAYLRKLPGTISRNSNMNVYVGGGLGLNHVSSDGIDVTFFNPTLLAGLNYVVSPELTVYGELAGGPSFLFASSGGNSDNKTGGFFHPRLGVTYTLRR